MGFPKQSLHALSRVGTFGSLSHRWCRPEIQFYFTKIHHPILPNLVHQFFNKFWSTHPASLILILLIFLFPCFKEVIKGSGFAEIQDCVTALLKKNPAVSRSFTNVVKSVMCLVATILDVSKTISVFVFLLYHSSNYLDTLVAGCSAIYVLQSSKHTNLRYLIAYN